MSHRYVVLFIQSSKIGDAVSDTEAVKIGAQGPKESYTVRGQIIDSAILSKHVKSNDRTILFTQLYSVGKDASVFIWEFRPYDLQFDSVFTEDGKRMMISRPDRLRNRALKRKKAASQAATEDTKEPNEEE